VPYILKGFGKKLRELRLERGLTQEQLAELASLSKNYVSDCERGTRNISLENIVALSRALKVKPSALLDHLV
jgi:transcriptional regulator with XRE-family HTH domain